MFDHPLLNIDDNGDLPGVRYSPRLDYMPLMDNAKSRAYHIARQKLGALFTNRNFEICFRLDAGDMVLFDNSRVLHGRTAFDPDEGLRHLQGCYIDRDGPSIQYQTLKREYEKCELHSLKPRG